MITKPLDAISLADIEQLLTEQVRDGKTIEYKRVLSVATDSDKREFLADVSSFANTGDGDIIFGVDAKDGVPTALKPIQIGNIDAETEDMHSYVQLFRNGAIELVESYTLDRRGRAFVIPYKRYEYMIVEGILRAIEILKKVDVNTPILLCVSLLGVQGLRMSDASLDRMGSDNEHPIQHKNLILPGALYDDYVPLFLGREQKRQIAGGNTKGKATYGRWSPVRDQGH